MSGFPNCSIDINTQFFLTLAVQSQFCAAMTPPPLLLRSHPRVEHPSEKRPNAISLLQLRATISAISSSAPCAIPSISAYISGVNLWTVRRYSSAITRTAGQSSFEVTRNMSAYTSICPWISDLSCWPCCSPIYRRICQSLVLTCVGIQVAYFARSSTQLDSSWGDCDCCLR